MTTFQFFLMIFCYTLLTHIINQIFLYRALRPYFASVEARLDQQEELVKYLLAENERLRQMNDEYKKGL